MAFSAPSLTRICVIKVVTDIKKFCYGLTFDDLGKFKFIVGPFDNLCETAHIHVHAHVYVHVHTCMRTCTHTHTQLLYGINSDSFNPRLN